MNAVKVKNLTKKYKEHTAVDGISFDVVNENLLVEDFQYPGFQYDVYTTTIE